MPHSQIMKIIQKLIIKTKLKVPIYLDGIYEVALVELLYPISWKYRPDGRINISLDKINIDYKIEFFIYESMPDLITRINEDFKLLQVCPNIDYHPTTQKIYLFIPENCLIMLMRLLDFLMHNIKVYQKPRELFSKVRILLNKT